MASRFNFTKILKTGDAKQRVLLIVAAVFVFFLILYLLSKVISFGSNAAGDSRVAGVPSISSVQGGKVSPEYARALNSENTQKVDYAASTGGSAIPTLINTGLDAIIPAQAGCSNCCNACSSESTDQMLSDLLSSGKISSSTADLLNKLSSENLSPDDYAAALAQMVRDGKISPEEARRLLAAYKQNYQDKIAAAGATDLDPLVKQGLLSIGAASDLLDLQKQSASSGAYQQALSDMVAQDQTSAGTAALLMQKYQEQQNKRLNAEEAGQLSSMIASGNISAETAAMLKALQASGVSSNDYANALNKLSADNKLSPDLAKRLLAEYNKKHGAGNTSNIDGMELSTAQGDALKAIQKAGQPVAVFAAQLEAYARSGQISAKSASQLLTAYQSEYEAKQSGDAARLKQAAEAKDGLIASLESKPKLPNHAAQELANLRNSSASLSDYAAELQRLIDAGSISSETAQTLLASYKKGFASNGNGVAFSGLSSPAIDVNLAAGSGNGSLDRVAQAGYAQQTAQTQQRRDYTAAYALHEQNQQAATLQQAQIQQMSEAMYAQAQQLFGPLITPPVQTLVTGSNTDSIATSSGTGNIAGDSVAGKNNASEAGAAPIIKAGTVLYAVLETAVDSDYPDSPVMASIVSGQYKGAKLLGSIKTVKDGQRVMLTFNLMSMNDWPTGATISAYAIDPDSARSAVATSVDNHYMLRYGTLFASSFIQGMGQAVQDSGTTVSSSSGVVTQSTADLNTEEQVLVALGQVGQNASAEVAKLQNTPPTVKVKAGIGIGVLFMSDVNAVKGVPAANASNISGS